MRFSPRLRAWLPCLCAGLLALCGCESFKNNKPTKFKNPVVGPPPHRMTNLLAEATPDVGSVRIADNGAEISLASGADEPEPTPTASKGEVAALVNGQPIFVDDVLQSVAANLDAEEQRLREHHTANEAELRYLRNLFVIRGLRPHIERQLLLQALRLKLKEDQIAGLEKHLDTMFLDEEKKMLKEFQVSTTSELDVELRKRGGSLAAQKSQFKNQHMAQQYLMVRSMPKTGFDRPDLLEFYNEHLEEYEYPAQVKWQEISISIKRHGGTAKARALAEELVADLENGADFTALARARSNGATAKSGGVWETKIGGLKDRDFEKMLFELPVGEITPPRELDGAFVIVRVLEKKEAGRKTFEEVQADIKHELREAQFHTAVKDVMKGLYDNADIDVLVSDNVPPESLTSGAKHAN